MRDGAAARDKQMADPTDRAPAPDLAVAGRSPGPRRPGDDPTGRAIRYGPRRPAMAFR